MATAIRTFTEVFVPFEGINCTESVEGGIREALRTLVNRPDFELAEGECATVDVDLLPRIPGGPYGDDSHMRVRLHVWPEGMSSFRAKDTYWNSFAADILPAILAQRPRKGKLLPFEPFSRLGCPKCGGRSLDPKYQKDGRGEALLWTCGCGYTFETATKSETEV